MEEKKHRAAFLALAEVVVPAVVEKQMEEKVWQNFLALLRDLDLATQKKLALLLKVLLLLSFCCGGSTYVSWTLPRREKFFKRLLALPLPLLVAGITGLKSLIFISYYGCEQSWEDLSYAGPLVSSPMPRVP